MRYCASLYMVYTYLNIFIAPQAFKAIKILLGKLEKFSEDPKAAAQQEKEEGQSNHT